MGQYHNRIMNIQSDVEDQNYESRIIYKTGHRDARHAAAEIAIEAEREIEELKERNIKLYDQLGEAYKEIMILENDLQEFIDNQPPLLGLTK